MLVNSEVCVPTAHDFAITLHQYPLDLDHFGRQLRTVRSDCTIMMYMIEDIDLDIHYYAFLELRHLRELGYVTHSPKISPWIFGPNFFLSTLRFLLRDE
jgi:hypothetical protein